MSDKEPPVIDAAQLLIDLEWLLAEGRKIAAAKAPEVGQHFDGKFDAMRRILTGQTVGISLRYVEAIIEALKCPPAVQFASIRQCDIDKAVQWAESPEGKQVLSDAKQMQAATAQLPSSLTAAIREKIGEWRKEADECKPEDEYYAMALARCAAELEQLLSQQSGWRDIATAPKDGTDIYGCCDNDGRPAGGL